MSGKIVVVTGASSGLGRLSAEALALAGHTVYAQMRDIFGRNASRAEAAGYFAKDNGVDLRIIEMDVQSSSSVAAAVDKMFNANGRIDAVVHSAAHLAFGPAEAFTPEQLTEQYDVNVVSTQRINRAVLPHLRRQKHGLLVWISCSSPAGGTAPYLAPYFAAKAAMDSLAVSYARELDRWGIETSIIIPRSFAVGAHHISRAGAPADRTVVDEYEVGPCAGLGSQVRGTLFDANKIPEPAASAVVETLVSVVDTPLGERPFRVHIDHTGDGADVGYAGLDRLNTETLDPVGLGDPSKPAWLV